MRLSGITILPAVLDPYLNCREVVLQKVKGALSLTTILHRSVDEGAEIDSGGLRLYLVSHSSIS